MKFIIIVLLFFTNLYALENRQALMKAIQQHAIRLGDGPDKVYAFIDPLCSQSQRYLELLFSREDLQEKNSYYIFLDALEQFDSHDLIAHIYQSDDPLTTLHDVIVYKDYDTDIYESTQKSALIISQIHKVVKQLNIKRRPYLILYNESSHECKVAEGTAPCMEAEKSK